MACTVTLSGIAYDCTPNLSGVKHIYVADYNDVVSYAVDSSNNNITAITMDTGKKFMEYVCAKNTASLTKTMTKDEANGNLYFTNEVSGNVNKMDASKRYEFSEISRGQLAVIVEDRNGEHWFLGQDEYATCTVLTGQTGASESDGNYYNFTITDYSRSLPYHIDSSIISALVD